MRPQGDTPDSLGVPPILDRTSQPTQSEPVPLKIPNLNNRQESDNSAGIVGSPGNAVLSSPPTRQPVVGSESSVEEMPARQPERTISPAMTQPTTYDKPPVSTSVESGRPTKQPPQPLKTGDFEVKNANQSIIYFIYGLLVMTIAASLIFLYLKSWQKNRAGQAVAKYQSQVESQLKAAQFIGKEKTVLNIGRQAAALQASLPGRIKFTQFLTELEKSTYKQVRFTRLAATDEGLVTLEGVANNFDDLAKAAEALKTSNNFSQVELATADKLNDGSVLFTINIALDKNSISGGNK